MYVHNIQVKPINCCFDAISNDVITASVDEYTNRPGASSIFFNDPLHSYFKCKSISASPFLELPIYDLFVGDELKITFEICKISDQAPKYFGCKFSGIKGNTVDTESDINYIAESQIDTYFKEFEINYIIPPLYNTKDGILVQIRPVSEIVQCEFTLRNINIEIKTRNSAFKCHDNYVRYNCKVDYLKNIKVVTKMSTNIYLGTCEGIYEEGKITLSQETILFNTTGTSGKWKGLASLLSSTKYSNPLLCYINYNGSTGSNVGIYNQPINRDTGWNPEFTLGFIPQTSAWTKDLFIMQNKCVDTTRGAIFNLGRTGEDIQIEIADVIFAHPRYDAQPYFEPNDLFELFPNLDLRAIVKGSTGSYEE